MILPVAATCSFSSYDVIYTHSYFIRHKPIALLVFIKHDE